VSVISSDMRWGPSDWDSKQANGCLCGVWMAGWLYPWIVKGVLIHQMRLCHESLLKYPNGEI
jgi:hypothetical protein